VAPQSKTERDDAMNKISDTAQAGVAEGRSPGEGRGRFEHAKLVRVDGFAAGKRSRRLAHPDFDQAVAALKRRGSSCCLDGQIRSRWSW